MPDPSPTPSAADRNLLFGTLALQLHFIDRDALIRAMHAWLLEKQKSLGQILMEHQALGGDEYAVLEGLVQKHLQKHGDDPQKSLASISSITSVRQELEQVANPDFQASLAHVSTTRLDCSDLIATPPPV
jgi:hypothetical protein